jgi:phosphate-selective porin OprO and OprP
MKSRFILFVLLVSLSFAANAQSTDDVLNLLIQKNVVSQKDADSIRAEAAIAEQAKQARVKSFAVNAGKKMQLGAYTQIRYQALEEQGKIDGFDIRRARVDLKGNLTPFLLYRLQFDLATTAKLVDAYAEINVNPHFNFTIGQAKIPFSYENLLNDSKLDFIDRSQGVEALVARSKDVVGNQNGRDVGIQLAGTLLKIKNRPALDYSLAVLDGAGINVSDNNERKDFSGRLVLHPIAGLDLAGSYYNGSRFIPEVKEVKNSKGEVTTPALTAKNVNRDRFGFDANYELKNLALRAEYINGTDDQVEREGYYFTAGYYFLQKKLQVLARYDFFDTDKAKAENASGWYVVGANYNFTSNIRLQANYTFKEEEGSSISNNYAAVQFQIGF